MDADRLPAVAGRTASPEGRCPACSARCAPDAPWCTLCYQDLRGVPAPETPPDALPDSPADAPADAACTAQRGAPDPAAHRAVDPAVDPADAAADAAADPAAAHHDLLLHRDAGPRLRLPLVTDLLAGPGGAVAVMLGGTVLVTAGVIALMWLLGTLL